MTAESQLQTLKNEKGLKFPHLNCLSLTKNIDKIREIVNTANVNGRPMTLKDSSAMEREFEITLNLWVALYILNKHELGNLELI